MCQQNCGFVKKSRQARHFFVITIKIFVNATETLQLEQNDNFHRLTL